MIDQTHLHLLLNHFSIIGALFGLILLTYGLIRKNKSLENAGLVTLVIIALITIPVFLTGEEAEETVEQLQGVSEYYMEQHEELAEIALWFMVATGGIALLTIIYSRIKKNSSALLKYLTLMLAAGTFGLMAVVGNYGGKIRHSELRGKAIPPIDQIDQSKEREHGNDD